MAKKSSKNHKIVSKVFFFHFLKRNWPNCETSPQKQKKNKKKNKKKQGVCHIVALPFTLKKYVKAKEEELWKLKYFTIAKIY